MWTETRYINFERHVLKMKKKTKKLIQIFWSTFLSWLLSSFWVCIKQTDFLFHCLKFAILPKWNKPILEIAGRVNTCCQARKTNTLEGARPPQNVAFWIVFQYLVKAQISHKIRLLRYTIVKFCSVNTNTTVIHVFVCFFGVECCI